MVLKLIPNQSMVIRDSTAQEVHSLKMIILNQESFYYVFLFIRKMLNKVQTIQSTALICMYISV